MDIHYQRVEQIRALMQSKGWDAVVVTGSDPHSSEYPARRWKQVEWITGFSGEAGDLVITADHAGLWTDSRYFIHARNVLPAAGVDLHPTRVVDQVPISRWLALQAAQRDPSLPEYVVAVDGMSQSADSVAEMEEAFAQVDADFRIVDASDFIDDMWTDRPSYPQSPVITLGDDLTGQSRSSKIEWLRGFLLDNRCDSILLSSLDEIAWVLNVRGSDIEYNPYVMSYLLVTMDEVSWFVRKNSAAPQHEDTVASASELRREGIRILPYDDVAIAVSGMFDDGYIHALYCDTSSLNYHVYSALALNIPPSAIHAGASPVPLRKAVKNQTEISGMRDAHLEDGLAMENFLYWVEKQVEYGDIVTEWDAACFLGDLRKQIPGYRGDSFETISAYGPGAALPHYVTPRGDDAPLLEGHGLYLCDSGGQYLYGTTDITRTIPLGECTPLEKEDYTLVLMGHINLAMAVFPYGTAGCQIDALARYSLWNTKRNFGHGTGHGVGFYLGVHEGPQDIRQNFNPQPLLPGMITSDEPGIYREGLHGVRHESLLLTVDEGENDFGHWLGFETLTLCHIDTSVIVKSLMSEAQIKWLNAYNRRVFESLSPRLSPEVAKWLSEKTRPI